ARRPVRRLLRTPRRPVRKPAPSARGRLPWTGRLLARRPDPPAPSRRRPGRRAPRGNSGTLRRQRALLRLPGPGSLAGPHPLRPIPEALARMTCARVCLLFFAFAPPFIGADPGRAAGEQYNIDIIAVDLPGRKTTLTHAPAIDVTPAVARDG